MKCRSCGAPIRWVLTVKGKRMPIDREASSEGTVYATWVDGDGWRAAIHTDAQPAPAGVSKYTPHHQTCPDADEWRTR